MRARIRGERGVREGIFLVDLFKRYYYVFSSSLRILCLGGSMI
jgi:hypothetical protein